MKLGIHLTGTLKGTITWMGLSRSKTLTVDHWLLTTPAIPPADPPLYEYDIVKGNLLPANFHVGGGSSMMKVYANFTGKAEVYEL